MISAERKDVVRTTGLVFVAAAIGFGYVLYLFPMDFLAGSAPWWNDAAPQDVKQEITGARYFIADDWQFPIFRTSKINPPEGIVIIYTASIPLLAFVAKVLRQILGVHGDFLGVWVGAAYVLQAVSIVVLLLSLGVRTFVPCMTAAVIALSAPTFLFRLFHTALISHFLVMLALSLYFFSTRSSSFHSIWPWFALLLWLALWTEAYFFVMILPIFLAAALQFVFARQNAWTQSALAVAISVVGSLCLMWVSGVFWGGGSPDGGGFGYYSVNLLSPWVPQWSGLFPGVSEIYGAKKGPWKEFIDATGGQYEGYSYLGAGALLLFVIALWLERRRLVLLIKRYWGLMFALSSLTILAITNRVYIGKWEIVVFEEVPSVFEQVRSSGRFLYPVVYTLLAASVAVVALRCRRWKGSVLLLVAMTIQVADATPIRKWVATVSESGSGERIALADEWRKIIPVHDRLTILPSFACRGDLRGNVFKAIVDLGFLASDSLTPISTTYLNRYRRADCLDEARRVVDLEVAEGDLLVLLRPYSEAVRTLPAHAGLRKICRSFDQGIACSRRWNEVDGLIRSDVFAPLNNRTQSYSLGTVIDFSYGGNSAEYNAFGWLKPETWGAWTYSGMAGLALRIDRAVASNLTLVAEASAFVTPQHAEQLVDVAVNGQIVGSWKFVYGWADIERKVTIPAEIAARQSPMHISFYIHDTKPLFDFRLFGGARLLGVGMRRLRILAETPPDQ